MRRQRESVRRPPRRDPPRRLGLPILDALRLVEHDDVRKEESVDAVGVAEHLFEVDEGQEGRLAIGGQTLRRRALDETGRAPAEAGKRRNRFAPPAGDEPRRLLLCVGLFAPQAAL